MKNNTDLIPDVAVVIPTYNRPSRLLKCLKSLLSQSLDTNKWEVLIVDDGSEVDMAEVLTFVAANENFRYYKQKNQGPARARNNGVENTTAPYIAFLDDDCEPHEDWLITLLAHKEENTIVGGHTINRLADNNYAEASQLLITYLYDYLIESPMLFFTSNNFMVPRKGFLEEGGFDIDFRTSAGEDRELCIRWTQRGRKLQYVKEALIYHSHDLSFKTYSKQHFKYGRASNAFRDKISFEGVDLKFSPLSFYGNLVFYPLGFAHFSFFRKMYLCILLALSQFYNAAGNRYDRFITWKNR